MSKLAHSDTKSMQCIEIEKLVKDGDVSYIVDEITALEEQVQGLQIYYIKDDIPPFAFGVMAGGFIVLCIVLGFRFLGGS